MGSQRVLQVAVLCGSCAAAVAAADPAPVATHERVAVIDLGPADGGATRHALATTLAAAGLDALAGDEADALAGDALSPDARQLADAMAAARAAMGALDCAAATASAHTAIELAAAREAAALPAPELSAAWGLVLACADRAGGAATGTAMYAASQLRAIGGGPADLLAKYPGVDVLGGAEQIEVDVAPTAPDAAVWIDHAKIGTGTTHVRITGGRHVIAAASADQRGAIELDVTRDMKTIAVPMTKQRGKWTDLANRVAGWHGRVPSPPELAAVLSQVSARVALVRYGETLEAWGQIGKAMPPRRIGGADGVGTLADAPKIAGAISNSVHAWNDHAPDPDQPLMVEARQIDRERRTEHTKWWVYAAGLGALAVVTGAVYLHDQATDTQHVELRYP